MIISLIGMSNSGKTYWSKKLEKEKNFKRFSCDDLIEEKLKKVLKGSTMSEWMGQPYEDRYKKNSAIYLSLEIKTMNEILSYIEDNSHKNENIVVDTTGSVIYTDKKIMEMLKKHTKILYIDTPKKVKTEIMRLYFENPKPVFWGKSFNIQNGETNEEALRRCYHLFLEFRCKEYKKHADATINFYELRSPLFDAGMLLKKIK